MKYPKNRRKYSRLIFNKDIKFNICYDKKISNETVDGITVNLSSGGFLFKTKWPPPTLSIIEIDLDIDTLKRYLLQNKIENDVNINFDIIYEKNSKIYGEVKRVTECSEKGFYDVAVCLIHKTKK